MGLNGEVGMFFFFVLVPEEAEAQTKTYMNKKLSTITKYIQVREHRLQDIAAEPNFYCVSTAQVVLYISK